MLRKIAQGPWVPQLAAATQKANTELEIINDAASSCIVCCHLTLINALNEWHCSSFVLQLIFN